MLVVVDRTSITCATGLLWSILEALITMELKPAEGAGAPTRSQRVLPSHIDWTSLQPLSAPWRAD